MSPDGARDGRRTDPDVDAVVVGAGIAGLACAAELQRHGASVRVFEARDRVGGKISTVRTPEGYLLEQGPHEVRSGDPEMFRQFEELGIESARKRANDTVARRYIVRNGRPLPIPTSPIGLLRTNLLSTRAKLRLLREPFIGPGQGEDESVASFFGRRLGEEVTRGPIDAFVSGVYAGSAAKISMRAAFHRLLEGEREHGSLFRWALARRRKRHWAVGKAELFSFEDGLRTWPEALAADLGPDRVRTDAPVRAIAPIAGGWRITWADGSSGRLREVEARHVVLALPAVQAGRLLAEVTPEHAAVLRQLPYAPVAVVHLAFPWERVDHPLDGFGVLAPGSERRDVLGMLWVSSLFDGRSPPGTSLTASFVGGARRPELAMEADDALIERVVAEHHALLGASGRPVFAHVHRWRAAIPQYDLGHPERLRTIAELEERWPGLHLTGNYVGGVGIPAAWAHGREVAGRIGDSLSAVSPAPVDRAEGSVPVRA